MDLKFFGYEIFKFIFGGLAAIFLAIGGFILLQQWSIWLRTAVWQPESIGQSLQSVGLYPCTPNYLGFQKIVDGILSWPASLVYACIGAIFCLLWLWAAEKATQAEPVLTRPNDRN